MSNGTNESELRSRYETFSPWAERVALLILLGLAVEIAAVFILEKSWSEAILTISANMLIIAGVWGELLLEKRAKQAGDGLVAIANARAAEAQLELERLKTPRFRLITSEASAKFIEKLKAFPGTKFDIGHARIGREHWDFLWVMEPLFPKANWVFVNWVGDGFFAKLPWTMVGRIYGEANVSNVSIELSPENREKLLPAATALAGVLNEIGIAAQVERQIIASRSETTDAIHILVGDRA